MAMVVDPDGKYFGFYSDFGDVSRWEVVSFSSAVASAAAAGVRDVVDLTIPDDLGSPTIGATHPKIQTADGSDSFIEILMTYDNGFWGDSDGSPFIASNFLVEVLGPSAADFVSGSDGPFAISHYVSADGGQSIYISSDTAGLFTGVTRIKIWRAVVFPGDPIQEPEAFWTGFLGGAREII